MKIMNLKLGLILVLFLATSSFNYAQEVYEASVKDSKVIIEGTSNIHDWEMSVEELKSTLKLNSESEMDIASISFEVPVKSMKSGKSRMDKNTYEALKAEDHSNIKFESTSIKESNAKLYAVGNLTIAGTVKTVEIPLELNKTQGKLTLVTSYKINMLDYNVEPPTAMFGTIKTGESVVVKFNLIY